MGAGLGKIVVTPEAPRSPDPWSLHRKVRKWLRVGILLWVALIVWPIMLPDAIVRRIIAVRASIAIVALLAFTYLMVLAAVGWSLLCPRCGRPFCSMEWRHRFKRSAGRVCPHCGLKYGEDPAASTTEVIC